MPKQSLPTKRQQEFIRSLREKVGREVYAETMIEVGLVTYRWPDGEPVPSDRNASKASASRLITALLAKVEATETSK